MSISLAAASAAPDAVPPLWRILTRFGWFAGLSGALGATLAYAAAVRPGLRGGEAGAAATAALERRAARYLAWTGVVLPVAGYAQLAARVARADEGTPFGRALAPGRIADLLGAPAEPGAWVARGTLLTVQNAVLVLAALALTALFTRRGRRHLDALVLTALPLCAAVTLVGSVPVKAAPEVLDDTLDRLLVQAHILGGAAWVGGLAALAAFAGLRGGRGGHAGVLWAGVWRRFGTVALAAVGAVLVSGLWLTWRSVGAPEQLWTTAFGVLLLVKTALVLGMVAAGAFNQFRLMPRIARARAADATPTLLRLTLRHFPRVVLGETVLGVAVLAVVPFLNGSARAQAGDAGDPPAATGGILAAGLALALTLAASLYATARASEALSRRTVRDGGTAPASAP
ncbi:CopD family protein [Streptomyces sp. NPDC001380]|uniref:CopD family protein n=1 Tax=Streptomyces sp. NPDC001380 TaxID=3364566 RepID=UPI0036ABAB5F